MTVAKFFKGDERGSLSIEAVLAVPMLVWAILATFVFWDAFKTINVSQKATYTVADLLSREERGIDTEYMSAMHEMYDFLSASTGDNGMRVTMVHMKQDPDTKVKTLELEWSHSVGGYPCITTIEELAARIPDIAGGERLIVVETTQEWSPAFGVGLASYNFREIALSRSRGSLLKWDTAAKPNCAIST